MRFISVVLVSIFVLTHISTAQSQNGVPVIVLTDINLVGGDPDDRQSLIHLLWYSDVLDIKAIVPDRWNGKGVDACEMAFEAFREDYESYAWSGRNFPSVEKLRQRLVRNKSDALPVMKGIVSASESPVYILVWGNMLTLKDFLFAYPELSERIRVFSIGTGRKYGPKDEVPGEDCNVSNWNGKGRQEIYEDPRFNTMWWIESNWTYNGMFMGDGPSKMFQMLQEYGAMGKQIKDVTKDHSWARYFRVGDTPSVTYLLDNDHNIEDPESSSWAGRFKKPFPDNKPNYYTDDNGDVNWDYENPCNTWGNLTEMYEYNKSTLYAERDDMYKHLIEKLDRIYDKK